MSASSASFSVAEGREGSPRGCCRDVLARVHGELEDLPHALRHVSTRRRRELARELRHNALRARERDVGHAQRAASTKLDPEIGSLRREPLARIGRALTPAIAARFTIHLGRWTSRLVVAVFERSFVEVAAAAQPTASSGNARGRRSSKRQRLISSRGSTCRSRNTSGALGQRAVAARFRSGT